MAKKPRSSVLLTVGPNHSGYWSSFALQVRVLGGTHLAGGRVFEWVVGVRCFP